MKKINRWKKKEAIYVFLFFAERRSYGIFFQDTDSSSLKIKGLLFLTKKI